MQAEQQQIKDQLDELTSLVEDQDVLAKINDFVAGSDKNALNVETRIYLGAINNQSPASGTLEQNRKNALIYAMGDTDPSADHAADKISTYDQLVLDFGEALQTGYKMTDGSSENIFGVYDQWALKNYKWEHQGYADRESFQAIALGWYTSAAALLEESLGARIDSAATSSVLESTLHSLQSQNGEIQALINGTANTPGSAVVRRPDNQRYYQVPGHEMLLSSTGTQQSLPYQNAGADDFPAPKGRAVNPHWDPFYQANGNDLPSAAWYRTVYADYGGKTPLYDIFFSTKEGNLTAPAGAGDSWYFVTSDISTVHEKEGWIVKTTSDNIYANLVSANDASFMKAWDNYGTNNKTQVHIAGHGDEEQYVYLPADTCARLLGVEPLPAG